MKKPATQTKTKNTTFKASDYVKPGVTEEDVVEIKEAFDLFDTDLGGSVDTKGMFIKICRIESSNDFSRI